MLFDPLFYFVQFWRTEYKVVATYADPEGRKSTVSLLQVEPLTGSLAAVNAVSRHQHHQAYLDNAMKKSISVHYYWLFSYSTYMYSTYYQVLKRSSLPL